PKLAVFIGSSPGHGLAVAPGPGDATLGPAPTPPHRGPFHGIRAAPARAAPGVGEFDRGLPADPGRTRRAPLTACTKHRVVDPEASRRRPRAATGRAGGNSCAYKPRVFLPPTSSASTPCCCTGSTSCASWSTPPA